MVKIALLISGRIINYDKGLLKLLSETKHEIDLFISINDKENKLYYDKMKNDLKKWLKKYNFEEYKIPDNFYNIYKADPIRLQIINGKKMPYNALSMFYNDRKAFDLAIKYADQHNFEYDCYMKFRADNHNTKFPDNINCKDNILHHVVPLSSFKTHGIYSTKCISDAFAWGNRYVMNIYCQAYEFVLYETKKSNGKYWVAFEDVITDVIRHNNILCKIYNIKYSIIQKTSQPE